MTSRQVRRLFSPLPLEQTDRIQHRLAWICANMDTNRTPRTSPSDVSQGRRFLSGVMNGPEAFDND